MTDFWVGLIVGLLPPLIIGGITLLWRRAKKKGAFQKLTDDVFVGFPSAERNRLRPIVEIIKNHGFGVQTDVIEDFQREIGDPDYFKPYREAIQSCRAIIFFVTDDTPTAKGQLREAIWIQQFVTERQVVVPVMLDETDTDMIPEEIATHRAFRVSGSITESAMSETLEHIKARLETLR